MSKTKSEQKQMTKKQYWGEVALWCAILLLLGAAVKIFVVHKPAAVPFNDIHITGGYTDIREAARCWEVSDYPYDERIVVDSAPAFIDFEVDLFTQGADADYVFNTSLDDRNVTKVMHLSDWLLLRYFNKELDRAVERQGLIPGLNLTCLMTGYAPYVLNSELTAPVYGSVRYSEQVNCHAPDGFHYDCDLNEKMHLWDLWEQMVNITDTMVRDAS